MQGRPSAAERYSTVVSLMPDLSAVASVVREVGSAEVVSRFRELAAGDITEKSPGDYVTIADQECERVLSGRLREIHDIPVVGEEASAADPRLLDLVATAPACWLLDPIDGTANFVAGSTDFVVMVALVEAGVSTAAWVWHPESDSMLTGRLGEGTTRNGRPISIGPAGSTVTGIVKRKYMPEPQRSQLRDFKPTGGALSPGLKCAGVEYAKVIDGELDFLLYWRTLPWDHAPCGLLAAEAGLRVARLDGSTYAPGDDAAGLLTAHPHHWQAIADQLRHALAEFE